MSVLLYGIVAEDMPLALEPDMQLVKSSGLAAVVIRNAAEISREPAAVLAYGERVLQIHRQSTLIPMRYGNVLANEGAVSLHLQNYAARYRLQLTELEGCEEMGIRLPLAQTADAAIEQVPASGLAYLLARKRAYTVPASAERQANRLNEALVGLYRQHRATLDRFNGRPTYLLSYLVPRASLPAFLGQLDNLGDHPAGIGSVSGPWPPYNFAHCLLA